jgi:ABC-type uncharacterized transport system permease subunit
MSTATALIAIALYALSTVLLVQRCRHEPAWDGHDRLRRAGLWSAGAALLFHGASLYGSLCCGDSSMLNLNVLNALSLVGWLTCLVIVVTSLRHPVENLAMLVMPLTVFALVMQVAIPTPTQFISTANTALELHILLSLLAYSLLTLAAIQAGMLAIQHNALRARKARGAIRFLPPLESVEQLMFHFIGAGFLLLTLALATGFVFLENIFAQHLAHKTLLSIVAWMLFALLLVGRRVWGWRGRTAVRWTTAGFVALLLAYFGTKIVLEWILGIHG